MWTYGAGRAGAHPYLTPGAGRAGGVEDDEFEDD